MKKILSLTAIAALVIGITFSGCKKDEEEYTPEALPEATIEGFVWADLNWANDTADTVTVYQYNQEYAPAGTILIATLYAGDLVDNPVAGYTYQTLTYQTEVQEDGSYSFTVPAHANGVSVSIKCTDFEYDEISMDWANYPATETDRVVYTASSFSVTVYPNITKIIDINY
ncbi:MAG TPA: hypothetical protein DDX39_07130 [Bacteroidales bacterium]|nr:MAG: hypothetical protein A2W98_12145 [Bacteroidetes bacterium GWF2_33_38]OFY75445.1 MAG: hypothetical protein A2265_11490 [Bacteroidetes bacterium RIFOXYA12_FULL_33_9]OFY91889.1 MAG: hypothetical protein A2236_06040 [Bacteroidetes bacterium RIFOXYA2_FULL_33_7]HBF88402.1 hypothetical protein [Bacteroidales bacterium]